MPPNRTRSTRASAKQSAPAQPAPPSSEDAKPNIDQLNAEAEAEFETHVEPPSDPPQPTSEPPQLPSDPQPEQPFEPQPELQSDPQPGHEHAEDQPIAEVSVSIGPPARRLDTLDSSRGKAKRPVAAPRFAGRRSQAKREQLEKEEQRRKEDEVKAAEDAVRAKNEADASTRGRGRGRGKGRGRGRYEDEGRRSPVASGPFSAGQVSKETQQLNRRWSSRGSGWKGLRVSGNKEGARGGRGKGKAAQNEDVETKPKLDANGDISMEDSGDDNDYVSSDADEFNGQRRMNVEKLGVIDLTQDESDLNQFAPIRVARVPHKERGFGVRHDHAVKQEDDAAVKVDTIEGDEVVSISKSKEVQQVPDVEVTSEATGFQAVYSDSESDSKPHIKLEADLDDAQSKENGALVSPQTITKGKEKVRARTLSTASVEEYDEEIEIDREEEQRQRKDLELLRAELGKVEKDGDALMSDLDAVERRAEKVYLFQFPPILPHLEPIFVKPDPDALDGNDVMQVDAPSSSNKPIMINDDGKGEQPRLPSGAVGKMKVHASGKVTLDWGRMTLTLGVGGKANFLQTVVAATLPDMKKDDGSPSRSEEAGQAINLGHVKEKFVVTPDWEELLG